MRKVILNIPHSSTVVPKWALRDIIIPTEELNELVDFMVDKDVDEIWEFVPNQNKVVASINRVVVDTERFTDDLKEPMASKGMGMFYTHTPDGKLFRIKKEEAYRKAIDIYNSYHKELEEKVETCLFECGKCVILDCHSFHDKMNYTNYDPSTFPDICIGTNGEIPTEAEIVIKSFKSHGYTVKINEPFSGAIVPLKFIDNPQVISIMIELNRRIYDNTEFSKVQNICKEIYNKLG